MTKDIFAAFIRVEAEYTIACEDHARAHREAQPYLRALAEATQRKERLRRERDALEVLAYEHCNRINKVSERRRGGGRPRKAPLTPEQQASALKAKLAKNPELRKLLLESLKED